MKILLTNQIKIADEFTIQQESISSIDLMERASQLFVKTFRTTYSRHFRTIVFAGPGNNGGDALAIARLLLANGYNIETYLFNPKDALSPDCRKNKERLLTVEGVKFTEVKDSFVPPMLDSDSIVIDGLFGSGLNKPLLGGFASVVRYINQSQAQIVSIDMPSGLFGEDNAGNTIDTIVRANETYTFHAPKLSFFFSENEQFIGKWQVLDIKLHPEAVMQSPTPYHWMENRNEIRSMLHTRKKFAHKGDFGHALLIAGSYGKMGAAILATKACLRSGVGLLTTHIPKEGYTAMQTAVPEAMVNVDKHSCYFTGISQLEPYNAIGIGPGIGLQPETSDVFLQLLPQVKVPTVLDADALSLLNSPEKIDLLPQGSILTPHVGEFNRLMQTTFESSYERLQAAMDFAFRTKTYLVLKGAYTAICTPERRCFFNSTANPGMATAGSGDVLTGIIIGLLAQGYSSQDAAILGVYIHGLSGDIALEKGSPESLIAGDIVENLAFAFRELRSMSSGH